VFAWEKTLSLTYLLTYLGNLADEEATNRLKLIAVDEMTSQQRHVVGRW